MLADQLQRDGVILGQRFWRFGMATPVLSVEEGRSGFSGIFEIVAAAKAGVVGRKRRPLCAGYIDRRPYVTLGTLAARSTSPPLPSQRGERARERWSTTCSSLTIPDLIPCVVVLRTADPLRCASDERGSGGIGQL
jgi:hypothetical protein